MFIIILLFCSCSSSKSYEYKLTKNELINKYILSMLLKPKLLYYIFIYHILKIH